MLCAVDVRRTYAYLARANGGYKAKAIVIQFPKVLEDASFHADKKLVASFYLSVNLRVAKTTLGELAYFAATSPHLPCKRMIEWRIHRVRQTCAAAIIRKLLDT